MITSDGIVTEAIPNVDRLPSVAIKVKVWKLQGGGYRAEQVMADFFTSYFSAHSPPPVQRHDVGIPIFIARPGYPAEPAPREFLDLLELYDWEHWCAFGVKTTAEERLVSYFASFPSPTIEVIFGDPYMMWDPASFSHGAHERFYKTGDVFKANDPRA